MRVLVTGGAGYIGSHTVLQLLERGDDVIVLDNLCNSSEEALERVAQLAGQAPKFVRGDVRDAALLAQVFAQSEFDAVVHFAGLKAVGESVAQPLRYYQNNVTGSLVLLEAMQAAKVNALVFSSSATVYGDPQQLPLNEESPCGQTTNPYGRSKWMVEQLLADVCSSDPNWRVARLRYFNPVGAHPSGLIGEDPSGIPNNLMPFISQVASGRRSELSVYGNDYPTIDGTGVRDYIHVMDLAAGHLAALNLLVSDRGAGIHTVNLGTGQGYSVLEVLAAFERSSGLQIPYRLVGRRPGDVASCYADPSRAADLLGWKAERGLAEMCADAWRWQSGNPNGYSTP